MRVEIVHDVVSNRAELFFIAREQPLTIMHPVIPPSSDKLGATWEFVEAAPGRDLPHPSLVIPLDLLRALVAAAGDYAAPSAATDRHLADAVDMRNRLFGLVEHLTRADVTATPSPR